MNDHRCLINFIRIVIDAYFVVPNNNNVELMKNTNFCLVFFHVLLSVKTHQLICYESITYLV